MRFVMQKQNIRLTYDDISTISSGLGMLLHSGTGTADALSMMAGDMEGTRLQPLLEHMAEEADEGLTLTQVFQGEECFPPHVTSLLSVGERTGHIEETLDSISAYYDSRSRMSRQIRDALIYPMILLVIMLVVIGVLLVYVLPIFNNVYQQLGGRLTGVAGVLLSMGQGISAVMPVLCVILVLVTAFVIAFAVSDPDMYYKMIIPVRDSIAADMVEPGQFSPFIIQIPNFHKNSPR